MYNGAARVKKPQTGGYSGGTRRLHEDIKARFTRWAPCQRGKDSVSVPPTPWKTRIRARARLLGRRRRTRLKISLSSALACGPLRVTLWIMRHRGEGDDHRSHRSQPGKTSPTLASSEALHRSRRSALSRARARARWVSAPREWDPREQHPRRPNPPHTHSTSQIIESRGVPPLPAPLPFPSGSLRPPHSSSPGPARPHRNTARPLPFNSESGTDRALRPVPWWWIGPVVSFRTGGGNGANAHVTFLGMFATLPFALAPAQPCPNQEEKGRTTTTAA